jgi:hypothetical protein
MTTITNNNELQLIDGGGKVECWGFALVWGADHICIGVSY